ncbi:MAG: DUF1993 domain-containing protein [Polyangiaceae bacterium]|nr:DUF1993 domain-containing protein [Polyangiaceae bacterium]
MNVYDLTVPQFIRVLAQARGWLDKAEAFAEKSQIDIQSLLTARLAPDQFHFTRQIQVLSDNAKGCAARLSGGDPPSFEDSEVTVADLRARLDRTIDFLKTLPPERFEGAAARRVRLFFLPPGKHLTGAEYLVEFGLPNFYFHAVTAYAILRSRGVELGKMDFIGQLSIRDDEAP